MKGVPTTILVVVVLGLLTVGASAQQKKTCPAEQKAKKEKVTCPLKTKLKNEGIKACPDTGCGNLDPLLNKQKNIDGWRAFSQLFTSV